MSSDVPELSPSVGRRDLPTGTVTFLFTDIEHSTLLLQELGERWAEVLSVHRQLMREAILAAGGIELGTEGDSFFVVFPSALEATTAAVNGQRALGGHIWPGFQLKVRMGVHSGEAKVVGEGYVGLDVHRAARIAAAGHGGQVLLSGPTMALIGNQLPAGVAARDLGEHRLKDLPRPERIFQLDIEGLPLEFPALKTLDVRRNNLPLQMTPFIGRDQELADARSLLAESRLVTLVGAGGMGKTRLAIELASGLLEESSDGVWLVELAPLSDPELIAPSLLTIVGLREQPGRTALNTLIDHLAGRRVLVVLDNCEHLIGGSAQVAATLLQACPKLRVLATSREPLGVPGETTWRIPSLGVPKWVPPLPQLLEWPAVALFADRAATAHPSFQLSEHTAPTVVDLCRQLDGIPLAIELAAARLKVLSLPQLAGRLSDRFRLLTGGSRSALPRQQTLRATIDWSFELLSEAEKALLRRVAVFAGGFDLEAAEAICGWNPLDPYDVLDLVAALASKSLIVIDEGDEQPRYGLLETIRQYAAERLGEAGEERTQKDRHRLWYLAVAERAEGELRGPDQLKWFDSLDRELDNLRSGHKAGLDATDWESSLRFAASLGLYWRVRGRLSEGRDWLSRALASPTTAASPARAKALAWSAYLGTYLGDYAEAELQAEQSLEIYKSLGDRSGIGFALQVRGSVASNQDDYDRALALERESLRYMSEAGDDHGQGFCYLYLAYIALQRAEYSDASAHLHEALSHLRRAGDTRATAIVLRLMGQQELRQGHYAAATALLGESLTIIREVKDRLDLNTGLQLLGRAARCEGDYQRALDLFHESLRLGRELNQHVAVGMALIELGIIARLEGHFQQARQLVAEGLHSLDARERLGVAIGLQAQALVFLMQGLTPPAVRLLAAAEALRQRARTPPALFDQIEAEREVRLLRNRLAESDFERLWAEGARLSTEEAIQLAIGEVTLDAAAGQT